MKKLSVLISFVLFSACSAYSMNNALVSFVYTVGNSLCYFKPSAVSRECYLDKLPLEVQGKIVENLLNVIAEKNLIDQKNPDRYKLQIPLFLGHKLVVNECAQMQKMCESKIGGKKFLAEELLCLPKAARDAFIRQANRSWLEAGDIDDVDYEIIAQYAPAKIKEGLCLGVAPSNKFFKTVDRMAGVGLSGGIGSTLLLSATVVMVPQESVLGACLFWIGAGGVAGGIVLSISSLVILVLHDEVLCSGKQDKKFGIQYKGFK